MLRRDRLGRPFLRPDQPRPGHRRHRPGRKSCWKSRSPSATPASSPGKTVGGVPPGETGDIDTGTDYQAGQARRRPAGQGDHEVRHRHRAEAAPGRRPRPRPGRDLRRREGQDRDQPQQAGQQSQGTSPLARTTPAPTAAPKRPITSRTGSSASRAASPATPTSRSASGRRRSATWSTSSATWAASASRCTGTRPPSVSPTATRPTSSSRRAAKATSCRRWGEEGGRLIPLRFR